MGSCKHWETPLDPEGLVLPSDLTLPPPFGKARKRGSPASAPPRGSASSHVQTDGGLGVGVGRLLASRPSTAVFKPCGCSIRPGADQTASTLKFCLLPRVACPWCPGHCQGTHSSWGRDRVGFVTHSRTSSPRLALKYSVVVEDRRYSKAHRWER